MTFIEACRAFKAVTGKLPLPITMMIEGEEECGSKNLFGFVRDNADEFKLDLALVCDTAHVGRRTRRRSPPRCAGWSTRRCKLTCADRDLHSGLFGGAAQNPIRVLSQDSCARCTTTTAASPFPASTTACRNCRPTSRPTCKALDLTPEKFLGQVGLKTPAGEKDRMLIEQITTRPTAEINGIIGGYTGEGAKTVIPGQGHRPRCRSAWSATQDPEKIRDAFRAFVQRAAAGRLHGRIRQFRPARRALQLAVRQSGAQQGARGAGRRNGARRRSRSAPAARSRSSATSRACSAWIRCMVGFALDDDRVHSPNEKFDLNCFHKGIRSWARILDALAEG